MAGNVKKYTIGFDIEFLKDEEITEKLMDRLEEKLYILLGYSPYTDEADENVKIESFCSKV